jgi:hypothetical protein
MLDAWLCDSVYIWASGRGPAGTVTGTVSLAQAAHCSVTSRLPMPASAARLW